VLSYRVRIAPMIPALTHATPDEIIGFEDAAFRHASLAIVHIRLRSGWFGAADSLSVSENATVAVLPARLQFLPDRPVPVPSDASRSGLGQVPKLARFAAFRGPRDGKQENGGRTPRYSRLNSPSGMHPIIAHPF
jgi:hypothetical protein